MSTAATVDSASGGGFGPALRAWRRHRGLSQLDLSLEAEISARHLSFLETGRSQPSQHMVLRLLEALRVPLWDRNRLLLTAGYAPTYARRDLDDQQLALVRRTLRLLLDRHDPYPAYAMDGAWNVVESNRTHQALISRLLPHANGEQVANILRLVFAPDLLRTVLIDWEACARAVLVRVARQLDGPEAPPALQAMLEEIRSYPGVSGLLREVEHSLRYDLFIPVALRVGDVTTRWITTILTFGAAVDLTLDELVVECFFPADEETELFVRGSQFKT